MTYIQLSAYWPEQRENLPSTKYLDLNVILFWWLEKNKGLTTKQQVEELYAYISERGSFSITYDKLKSRSLQLDTKGILIMALSACGASPSQTPSNNNDDTKTDVTTSKDVDNSGNSTSNATEEFLKTITAETAGAKGVCGPDLTWYYQDNVLVIKSTGEMSSCRTTKDTPWNIEATDQFNDSEGKSLYDRISWVRIDEGVTSIGENAFKQCEMLSKVALPSTLEHIDDEAVYSCNNLTEITIPSSVIYLGINVFCNGGEGTLESVTFLGNIPENGDEILRATRFEDVTLYYSGSTFDEYINIQI